MTSPEQKAELLPKLGIRILRERYDGLYLLNILNNKESAEARFTISHAKAMALVTFYTMYHDDPIGRIAYESDGLFDGLRAQSRMDVALEAEAYLKEISYEQTMRTRLKEEDMSDIVDAMDEFAISADGVIGKELQWSNLNDTDPSGQMRGIIESAEIGFTLDDPFGNPVAANLLVVNSDSHTGDSVANRLGGRSGVILNYVHNLWIADKIN